MTPSIFESDYSPTDVVNLPTYRTQNIGFVAAALASDIMGYVRVEAVNQSQVVFTLTDRGERGSELERQFRHGVFPKVNPKLFLDARAFLQDEIVRMRKLGEVKREQA
jgi:hypothetical protein